MADLSQFTDEELRRFAAGDTAPAPITSMSDAQLQAIAGQKPASAIDRAQAAASGVNKGALSYLPGLPVKAALDVADLVRAGYGTLGGALGMPADTMPSLINREQFPMSPEWIQAKIRAAGGGKIIDPNQPADPFSRVLHSAGTAIGAAPVPGSLIKQGASGGISQLAQELGASPEVATLAGLSPFAGAARTPRPPQQPILTPEQLALRQQAKDYGYELTPYQESGKQWQGNLEGVMRQAPTTSGRMQAIDARNQILTNKIVSDAVDAAGGPMDQGTAGGSAFTAMNAGIAKQAENTGAGYRKLLQNVPVDIASQYPAFSSILGRQKQLPESLQGKQAIGALSDLLGSADYGKSTSSRGQLKPIVNPAVDDMATAIRKLGGITPGDEAIGSLSKHYVFPPDPRNGPFWTKNGASLDGMAEKLHELGYIQDRSALTETMSKIEDMALGVNDHFSVFRQQGGPDPLAESIQALTRKLGEKNAPPAPRAGFLRDNPVVPGELAQDMRSAYTAAATETKNTQQAGIYRDMRKAVDAAIEKSVPADKRGQFSALNLKYGYDKAIAEMAPKSQEAFLAQLYRGAPDQFYTFLGVVDPASFSTTARGFISKLVERATKDETGNISARKLGSEIDALSPGATGRADVMKYFGGAAEKPLRDVGNIGQNILPEASGNPGTAQRLFYQALLRGGGLVGAGGGAGIGALSGGGAGAMLGAAAGSALGNFAIPAAIQGAYLSPRMRGLLVGSGKGKIPLSQQEDLLRRYGGLLGYSAAAGQ